MIYTQLLTLTVMFASAGQVGTFPTTGGQVDYRAAVMANNVVLVVEGDVKTSSVSTGEYRAAVSTVWLNSCNDLNMCRTDSFRGTFSRSGHSSKAQVATLRVANSLSEIKKLMQVRKVKMLELMVPRDWPDVASISGSLTWAGADPTCSHLVKAFVPVEHLAAIVPNRAKDDTGGCASVVHTTTGQILALKTTAELTTELNRILGGGARGGV